MLAQLWLGGSLPTEWWSPRSFPYISTNRGTSLLNSCCSCVYFNREDTTVSTVSHFQLIIQKVGEILYVYVPSFVFILKCKYTHQRRKCSGDYIASYPAWRQSITLSYNFSLIIRKGGNVVTPSPWERRMSSASDDLSINAYSQD